MSQHRVIQTRKRRLPTEIEPTTTPPSSSPSAKRQKQDHRQTTPSYFWDNLSRVPLVPRALKEFNRRKKLLAVPARPGLGLLEASHARSLKHFARLGGPDLSCLRGYLKPPISRLMSRSQSGSRSRAPSPSASNKSNTTNKSSTRKSSAYDSGFEQHLIDHGVYPEGHGGDVQEPDNLKEIMDRLAQARSSLSPSRPSKEEFREFKQLNREALSEKTVMRTIFPIITGTAKIPHAEDLLFGNLQSLTDGSISCARPDLYDGCRPAEIDKLIREEIGSYIVPSTNKSAPCLPNFFVEGKGPNGSALVAERQALYVGALSARGVDYVRLFIDPEAGYDKNAHTIISTYHGGSGNLTLYAIHSTQSDKHTNGVEYHMNQLDGWKITGNPDAFRLGAAALRNARDWAKEKRDSLVANANAKANAMKSSGLASPTQSFLSQATDKDAVVGSSESIEEPANQNEPDVRSERPAKSGSNHSSRSSSRRLRKIAARQRGAGQGPGL